MADQYVLVTGGAGHVGSHLVERLVADPRNRVVSLDNYSNGSEQNHLPGAEYLVGHTAEVGSLVEGRPDVVYHLGEYARIGPSFDEPAVVFDANLRGTVAVLEWCRQQGVGKLVYSASSTRFAVEGDGRDQSPYAFTKAMSTDLIRDYGRWYGVRYAICYFYNAFGPREVGTGRYATLIARFEQAYLRGEALPVVRPGTQKRNFTYVEDLARGIEAVGRAGEGDGYALYNEHAYSIEEVAQAFGGPIRYVDGRPGRAQSGTSPTRARDELGWKTTVDVIDYIRDFCARHPRGPGSGAARG